MSQAQQATDDLHFVRQAVDRRERSRNIPTPIAWTVASYVLVGYTLLDFNPAWASLFFAIAGVGMGVLFPLLGRRMSRQEGEFDRAEVVRLNLHWGSILLAIAGVIALGIARHVEGQTIGQFIALTIGLIYFLGGVHFDRNLLWLGPLLMAGAVAITYVPHYGWTALGALVALGLVVPTWFRTRSATAA
jgi:hypothetical protein